MYKFQRITVVFLMVSFFGAVIWADVKPAGIFGQHMVLQRDIDVPVWGWAQPGEAVTVEFAGQKASAKADADGKWMVRLKPMPASAEGREMVLRGPKNTVTLKDVLVGEVWVCSGQSNMGWPVARSKNPKEEIAAANYPLIRHITVAHKPNANLSKDTSGAWLVCSPKTAHWFTAVAIRSARKDFTSATTSVYCGSACMVAGSPSMCINTIGLFRAPARGSYRDRPAPRRRR